MECLKRSGDKQPNALHIICVTVSEQVAVANPGLELRGRRGVVLLARRLFFLL